VLKRTLALKNNTALSTESNGSLLEGKMEPVLVLKGITKRYGRLKVVDNFSLEVEPHAFCSIIGPSGCGKTILLRIICGLEKPDAGSISIRGKLVNNVSTRNRNLALVFQSFALFPHMNVYKNVEFGLKMHRIEPDERRKRVIETLTMLGMEAFVDRGVYQLSGGEMQRVGLARALVVKPDVLLLDEPLGALDAKIRIAMQSELKSLQRKLGVTIVHITNNQAEALAMADKVVVMNKGKIEMTGTPDQVYGGPKTKFVAQFVGKNNIFEGKIVRVNRGEVRVETDLGVMTAKGVEVQKNPGDSVTLIVRAESFKTEGNLQEYPNSLEGALVGLEYQGSTVTYTLNVQNQTIRMERHESLARHKPPAHGENVKIFWRAEDSHVIPA
jgi:spermidine/putrescine transport system ATP-binding protein